MAKVNTPRNYLARLYRFLTILGILVTGACTGEPDIRPLPTLPPKLTEVRPALRPARPRKEFTIAWTGELRGEVEPCGCPTVPYGGLERRERLLQKLRKDDLPLFVLDAGSMLVKGQNSSDQKRRKERARFLLRNLQEMGLDAWAPSPVDLMPGGLEILEGSPAISANWTDASGAAVLPGVRMIERGGVRLGVLGLSDPGELPVKEPISALKAAMEGQQVDGWVLLSNAPTALQKQAAEAISELGVVLSVRGESTDEPVLTAGAPILEVPDRGRYVSVLRVMSAATPGPWELKEEGSWGRYATARRLSLEAQGASREDFQRKIQDLQRELEPDLSGRAVVLPYNVALGSDLDGETMVRLSLEEFKKQAREAAEATAAARSLQEGYQTAAGCMSCHRDRFAAWTFDPHSKAWDALLQRDAEQNPECLECHSTGYGEPGGFGEPTFANTSRYKAVQCEACHGPMATHPDDGHQPGIPGPDKCTTCHDEANSPSFDYALYLRRISCTMVSQQEHAPKAPATPEGSR